VYKAGECIYKYLQYETVSANSLEMQGTFPIPYICFVSKPFVEKQLLKLNLSEEEYTDGAKWTTANMTPEELYEFASPKYEDILKKIEVGASRPNTDLYDEVHFDASMKSDELKKKGLIVKRFDYQSGLKRYCLQFSFEHGVQEIKIFPQPGVSVKFYIVSPGNLLSYERKRNKIEISPKYEYKYQIYHSVNVKLALRNRPCSFAIEWVQDECRMNFVNKLAIRVLE
jgi:hypothetical protein